MGCGREIISAEKERSGQRNHVLEKFSGKIWDLYSEKIYSPGDGPIEHPNQ